MKQLSILFILFLLYSFTTTTLIITRIHGPKTCESGYLRKCSAFAMQAFCKCFKECQVGQKMECKIVQLHDISCFCVDE